MNISFTVPEPFEFISFRRQWRGGYMAYVGLDNFHGGEGLGAVPQEAIDMACQKCLAAKAAWQEEVKSRPAKRQKGVEITLADLGL